MNTAAVQFPKGIYNPGGTTQVWYAVTADVLTMPALDTPTTVGATFSTLSTYADAIVMKTGKQFQPLYGTPETGSVKCALAGSRDGKGFENSVEVSYPGNDGTFLGFKAFVANEDLILIVREKNGTLRVIGDLDTPAFLDSDAETSGAKISDARESKMVFKASAATPAPIYGETMDSLLVAAS